MISSIRKQFSEFWQHQSNTRRLLYIALVISVVILVPLILSWASTPTYSVAFSGLNDTDAGAIVQQLDEEGVDYQLRDGSTILVPSDQVYAVRLQMATAGLPESSTVGFELFDSTSLGMTEFTQKVNYQRALEGELERTIGSMSSVSAVRVHIVTPEKSLLGGEQAPTTASVTVDVQSGNRLDDGQVQSITHLLASSVENLSPENVVVVDTKGNMLAAGGGEADSLSGAAQTGNQRSAEVAAAEKIQDKVQQLLDSALGPNRSVVQASVIMDWTQRETTTQSFTPDPTAVRSEQNVTESYSTDGSVTGGIPGAVSNLPTPSATGTAATSTGEYVYLRTEETINYEMNQVESHEISGPGEVEKISLSVLVDGVTDTAQLDTIKSAVAAAAGIDETRGDILAVETLAFDRSYYTAQEEELEQTEQTSMYFQYGQYAALALVLILLLWYVGRLFRNLRVSSSEAWTPILKPVSEMAALPGGGMGALGQPMRPLAFPQPSDAQGGEGHLPEVHLPEIPARMQQQAASPEDEQMQRVITRLAEESPANVAEILSVWLNEDEK